MKLTELLKPWVTTIPNDCDLSGLQNDSRLIKPGDLFVAYPGALVDGRHYIPQAIKAGAHAVLYESLNTPSPVFSTDCIGVPIPGLEKKLAAIASRFYSEPTHHLTFTGVTGTNGKTTIAYQLAQAYELLGQEAAYVGTLGQGKPCSLQALNNTTPDALILQSLFHQYHQGAIKQVCMEVSSHALSQHRVEEIPFKQAIFTNLTHDHLDYHQTMEAYAEAKSLLFAKPSLNWVVLNQDDSYADVMRAKVPSSCQVLSYGIHDTADVHAHTWEVNLQGTTIHVNSPWGAHTLTIQALGFFNLYNALAIFSSLVVAGCDPNAAVRVMAKLKPAPGRMEVVAQEPTVIVDYAHTPDALENVLATLSKVKLGRILVVFGCGGDRDKLKRPIMGKIASRYADWVFLTSDNPRHEDPEQILTDIEVGIPEHTAIERICDRESAIARALAVAQKNDIVVIAGKGHETYQQIGDQRFSFSDQEIVRNFVNTP
jgi:UDP-N-acetylmuramoyl-L-alanyl-D-glutamate--2,6-diaminopimelate ligase